MSTVLYCATLTESVKIMGCHVRKLYICYCVYENNWLATHGELLDCVRDAQYPFSVAVPKDGAVVGNVPRHYSCYSCVVCRPLNRSHVWSI